MVIKVKLCPQNRPVLGNSHINKIALHGKEQKWRRLSRNLERCYKKANHNRIKKGWNRKSGSGPFFSIRSFCVGCITITLFLLFVLPTDLSERNSTDLCPPEHHMYMIQLTFRVTWEVCAIGEPYLNWQPDTDNKVWSDKEALGMPLTSSTEDYVVCKSCLISSREEKEQGTWFMFSAFFFLLNSTFSQCRHQVALVFWCF